MVFCGKPSGGCHSCRARKTRCDKVPEGCTQCKRAKRECPGYRNQGDLNFRDESSKVVQKFKAKEAKKRALASPTQETALESDDIEDIDLISEIDSSSSEVLEIVQRPYSPLSATYTLAPTLEDRATSFFLFNYVMGLRGPSRGHLDHLANLWREQRIDDNLMTGMKAVGLAAYAHKAGAPSLLQNARYQYMKAIQLTNASLRDPEAAKSDSTLMAIQILGIFETVTGCRQKSLKAWSEHIHGAAAVIKLRGPEQLRTPTGRRMFVQVTSYLMITTLQIGCRLPQHIQDLMNTISRSIENPEAGLIVQQKMMLYTELRADIIEKVVTDPQTILSRALELDGALLDICMDIPVGWEYETIYTDIESDIIYNGCYHIYYDHWISQIWNALRTLRIMLHETIREVLLEGFSAKPPLFTQPEHTAQFQMSTETCFSLQADILSSVPQHIGRGSPPQIANPELMSRDSLRENISPIPMSAGAFLMWPLWFAGMMDNASNDVRTFVAKNLHFIGEVLGIQQSHVLARSVETKTFHEVFNEK